MRTHSNRPGRGNLTGKSAIENIREKKHTSSRNRTDRWTGIGRIANIFLGMADMRLVVLATILLTLILTGEIQRCSGQIHYKVPGWGPGGKRSSLVAGSNVLRKRHWRLDSQLEEVSGEKQQHLALLQRIAKALAQKFAAPTLDDEETVRDQLTEDQWRENEGNDRWDAWN